MTIRAKMLIALVAVVTISLLITGAFFYGVVQGKAKCQLAQAEQVIQLKEKTEKQDETIERQTPRNKSTEEKLDYILDHAVKR